jgi:hypothetical protein
MQNDVINHPKHYCREGGMESIDEMVIVFGREAVMNFCLCNIWKYRYRAADKNGEEDLEKSDWYMRKYNELLKDKLEEEYGKDSVIMVPPVGTPVLNTEQYYTSCIQQN